jgi:hypothetical protein
MLQSSLKRVPEKIFKNKQKPKFYFLLKKFRKNCQRTLRYSSIDIKAFKQLSSYPSHDPVPLNTRPIMEDA